VRVGGPAGAGPPAVLSLDRKLDSEIGKEIVDLLLGLNAEHGTTLVIATHDQSIAERCGQVLRIRDGRVS
jgi:putative ABC transport system ATP-binding protein